MRNSTRSLQRWIFQSKTLWRSGPRQRYHIPHWKRSSSGPTYSTSWSCYVGKETSAIRLSSLGEISGTPLTSSIDATRHYTCLLYDWMIKWRSCFIISWWAFTICPVWWRVHRRGTVIGTLIGLVGPVRAIISRPIACSTRHRCGRWSGCWRGCRVPAVWSTGSTSSD